MLLGLVAPPQARKSAAVLGALICVLGFAWEAWLVPLRPGSLLWLKVMPLLVCLPSLWRGSIVMHQWWSMAALLYFTEGVVRATTEDGLSRWLASIEIVASLAMWIAVLTYVASVRWAVRNRSTA